MVKAEEVESFGAFGEVRDPGLLRVQSQPEYVQDRRRQLAGLLSPVAGGAKDDEVVAVSDQRPVPPPAHASSSMCRAMFASNGEIGEPWGVPASIADTTPPSNTPARSQPRSSF